ncbi:siderophore-interacting protein [Shewanella vesiculosa]|uniref:siderophore-interacting protein n=1 Tax=Shewanella vesiculosa TaxID=518738 RepID=UPI00384E10CC
MNKSEYSLVKNKVTTRASGFLENAVQKLFTRGATITVIEKINSKFRIITLEGEPLKNVNWTPGDKIQIQLGGWVQRTYTPMEWDPLLGRTRILVYTHGDSPGANWAKGLKCGDRCVVFGPRASIDLTQLTFPIILFGDETSIALASVIHTMAETENQVQVMLEINANEEAKTVIERLGLTKIVSNMGCPDTDYLLDQNNKIAGLLATYPSAQFVLTGKSNSIKLMRKYLQQSNVERARLTSQIYWAPGKTGLD